MLCSNLNSRTHHYHDHDHDHDHDHKHPHNHDHLPEKTANIAEKQFIQQTTTKLKIFVLLPLEPFYFNLIHIVYLILPLIITHLQ